MNKFGYRKWIIIGMVVIVCLIYIIYLFTIQVVDDYYKIRAENNSQRVDIIYPARGLIYDRNDRLVVDNQAAYDLMIIPRQVKAFDTTELVQIIGISKELLEKNIERCRRYSPYKPSVLISQITGDKYAVLQEKLYRYPGFEIQTRTLRKYHVNHSGGLFGYISEVSPEDIEKNSYYGLGDYIGKTGLEETYEHILRGEKGKKITLVDNFGREKDSYADGEYDEEATVGQNLQMTLDMDLQEYVHILMQNKKGGIVAIEPKTGEILVKYSAPSYDPQLMVGLERGRNYTSFVNDTLKPLFDRTVMAQYPPGSIFKTVQALIGLQTGAVTTASQFSCNGSTPTPIGGGSTMRCHNHPTPLDLRQSIEHSCNPYYVNVFRRILELPAYGNVRNGYNEWRGYATSFGFGSKITADIPNELPGSIPTQAYYDKEIKTKNWHALYIISLSIGQGELLITPLQMANQAVIVANRGYYITPHLVRPPDEESQKKIERHDVKIDPKYFEPVVDGMKRVVTNGTGRRAHVDSIVVAGKTGTVQNPPNTPHSVFIAFAPADDPQIALAVYVENGDGGSKFAAPIAGLLIEKYLKGRISSSKLELEKWIIESNLIENERNRNKNRR